ncbi:GNAT family N-acetyltransferase [Pseudomonas sp. Marseille-P9899]|uniref:GNAT family N-acetyltransferase n=1 Tax=Pseudomonas sp. Marseille-P9899 TaxID=2730401 RepID=UPI00158E108C|nr:GNAT family N-acetyltransferase [Pseudomonas sp. Marseille-P9899]
MDVHISLRRATLEDGQALLDWRNDDATREASHCTEPVDVEGHMAWLEQVLENPDRALFIAEKSGTRVGTVRADCDGVETELSWTVAPEARGTGVAKEMLRLVMREVAGPFKAEVKTNNKASLRVAAGAGLHIEKEERGIAYFRS